VPPKLGKVERANMGRKRFKRNGSKRAGGSFFALPCRVLDSRAYIGLSMYARALLIDLGAQYRGDNNGDLAAPWRLMKARGWRSQDTLHKAKRELLSAGLIVETRLGSRPNRATLYALTFYGIDDCGGKLDLPAKAFPFGQWARSEPALPLVEGTRGRRSGANPNTPGVATVTG